jgi:hypothetical protein
MQYTFSISKESGSLTYNNLVTLTIQFHLPFSVYSKRSDT